MPFGLFYLIGDQCCVISSDNDPTLNRCKGLQRLRRQELTDELKDGGFLRPEPPATRYVVPVIHGPLVVATSIASITPSFVLQEVHQPDETVSTVPIIHDAVGGDAQEDGDLITHDAGGGHWNDIEYLPPRHLLPWSNSEEEDDAQEELLLSPNQEMWNEKYLRYLLHFGYDPKQYGGIRPSCDEC